MNIQRSFSNGNRCSGRQESESGNQMTNAVNTVIRKNNSNCLNRKTITVNIVKRDTLVPLEMMNANSISFICGLTSGVIQAGIFNPVDRALYLSITSRTPFLCMENFRHPYQGFFQSIGGKALSGGLYYPLEKFFLSNMNLSDNHNSSSTCDNFANGSLRLFLAGTAAGAVNAIVMNPLTTIRYKTWGRNTPLRSNSSSVGGSGNVGMIREASQMFRQSGGSIHPFLKGLHPTLMRDITFGSCYTFLRLQIKNECNVEPDHQWIVNLFSAAVATILSSPFNFVRNIQYASKSSVVAPTTTQVLHSLIRDTKHHHNRHHLYNRHYFTSSSQQQHRQPHRMPPRLPKLSSQTLSSLYTTIFITTKTCRYFAARLRIGWGTTRGALGMAFGQWIYDQLHSALTIQSCQFD